MNEEGQNRYEDTMGSYLRSRVSRAHMLKAAGIGIAAAALPAAASAQTAPQLAPASAPYGALNFPYYPQVAGTYTPEAIADILNVAHTAETFIVTFLTAALQPATAAAIGLTGLTLQIVQAVLVEEVAHLQFLSAAGATPLATTFTVPDPKMLSDFTTFFNTLEAGDTIFNAAYMAATREFAELGQPTLAKIAYQIGSVEAEHRTLARAALALRGVAADIPPNNKAFETDLFLYVRDAAALLTQLGFLGGSGTKATFQGTDAALSVAGSMAQAAVIQKTPNNATTSITASDSIVGERK